MTGAQLTLFVSGDEEEVGECEHGQPDGDCEACAEEYAHDLWICRLEDDAKERRDWREDR